MIPLGTAVGLADNMIKTIREHKNRNEIIKITCKRCHFNGSHKFAYIKFPLLLPSFMGDKVFRCENCGALMLKNGEIIVTLFDRVEGFIKYPKLIQTMNDLEFMVAQNQNIASKHREEILKLKNELNNVNFDKDLILKKITELISKIKKEAA